MSVNHLLHHFGISAEIHRINAIVVPKVIPSIMNSHVQDWKVNALFQSQCMAVVFIM